MLICHPIVDLSLVATDFCYVFVAKVCCHVNSQIKFDYIYVGLITPQIKNISQHFYMHDITFLSAFGLRRGFSTTVLSLHFSIKILNTD